VGNDVGNDAFVPPDAPSPQIHAACVTTALAMLGAPAGASFALPTLAGTTAGFAYTLCPNGSNPAANPPVCFAEVDWTNAALTVTTDTTTAIELTGTLPLRIQDVPLQTTCSIGHVAFDGDGACPGGNFGMVPVDLQITIGSASLAVGQVTSASQLG